MTEHCIAGNFRVDIWTGSIMKIKPLLPVEIQLAQSPLTAPVTQFLTERSLLGPHDS